ncbi:MAG: thiamine-phosphate kinase [Myxococcota bacterium]
MTDDPDESWVISRFEGIGSGAVLGIGDDAAVLASGEVVTTDTMVEGVHWDARLDPADVGWKLVAVNVSDVGAMGATPTWATLALTLPAPLDRAWVEAFASGVREACDRWGVSLVGGDTTRGPARVATLTMAGAATRPVSRAGGRPGDRLYVTGTLGLAAEGLLSATPSPGARAWLRRPCPPVAFGAAIAPYASAMMDLSDGLSRDLHRLCAASGCGADVRSAALPGEGPIAWRTSFGEDYELLFAAPPEHAGAVESVATMLGVSITGIGALTAGRAVLLDGGAAWPPLLFSHFGAGG